MPIRAERHTIQRTGVTSQFLTDRLARAGVHSRTLPSTSAEARRWPSGLYATPFTWPVWPVMIFSVLARAITAA